ncbi:Integrins alpha chain [Bathymodiolus thermophilus thioautotrophic gill symbiont]|uniref:Integrins alpha chain n=1 Tax=Bathymodiolus thermophilus thioautotrophic gill symbiont TaxID=2360 RepID=A0A3G3IJQ5_9GAMM|nr:Ig-like domain-containing protein [Bathymodiolus thermophilus thioautotrophic gill symbiont]AYQ56080.1 Integrins alpha chain [Bathymodiolus thermophilus thioautotrophic gill symbiont]
MKNTKTEVITKKQITTLQNKAQKIADKLNEEAVILTKGVQHIQVQAGTVYQLSTQDFNTKKLNLIAKKVGNDLEVALEESVVVFDNYFDVCATDLSCLVSLPAENGGLYHIVPDTFFTLEDNTQVVYFYGEQSIVSTESSTVSTNNNQSFFDVVTSNIGIVAVVLVVAVVAGNGSSNDNGNNENEEDDGTAGKTIITGAVNLGPITSNSLRVQAFVGKTTISKEFIVDVGGEFTITLDKSYNQGAIITLKLTDTTDTADYLDEALNAVKDLDSDLRAIIVIQSADTKVNITPLTDIAAKIISEQTIITEELVNNTNTQVGKVFGISGNVTTEEVKTVINKEGVIITTSNTYGQALAVVSQFEKDAKASDTTIKTSDTNKKIADSINIEEASITDNDIKAKLKAAEVTANIKYDITPNNHFDTTEVIPVIEVVATDDVINFSEKDNTSITGTVKTGSTVVLSIDGSNRNASVSGATWHYALTNADITAIEGKTINIIATATDINNKISISNTKIITVDTIAPAFDSSPTTINIVVNTPITTTIYDAQATNLRGGNADDGITYSIKEADTSKFLITNTGIVTYKVKQTSAHNNDTVTIIATDNAGNTTQQLVTVSVKSVSLVTSIIWDNINDNNIINASDLSTVTLSGTVTTNSAITGISITDITFKQGDNIVHKITSNLPSISSDNTWTLAHSDTWVSKLGNGDYTVVVNLSGNNGSISGQGITTVVTIDTVAPDQPTIALTDGTSNTKDGTITTSTLNTNDTRVYHLKKGEVEVTSVTDEATYATYMAGADEVTYTLTIVDTDNAGNVSVSSNALTFILDKTPPNLPTLVLEADSGLTGDNITNNGRLTVANVSNGDTITYLVTKDNGMPLVAMTAEEYTTYITSDNKDGNYSVKVIVTDAAGNTSDALKTFVLDTTNPIFDQQSTTINIPINVPITTIIYDAQATDLNGDTDKGITYKIKNADASKFLITADTGIVTYKTIQTSTHDNDTATIIATDTAGNEKEQLITVSVKNIALSTSIAWNGIGNDHIVNINEKAMATLSGTVATIGAVTGISIVDITFKQGDNIVHKITSNLPSISSDNTWTLAHSDTWVSKLGNGDYTVVVNLSGNNGSISGQGITTVVTIDTVAPDQPTIALTDGTSNTKDGTITTSTLNTNDTRVYHLKKGEVEVTSVTDEATYATYMAGADEVTYTLTIVDTDNAGNVSVSSNALTFILDKTPPNSPTLALETNSGLTSDNITNNGRLTVTNVSNGDTITYLVTKDSGTPLIAMTAGEYTTYITSDNKDGNYSVKVIVTDAAGNTSDTVKTFVLDTTPPTVPTLNLIDTGVSDSDGITNNGTITVGNLDSNATWQYSINGGTNFINGTNSSFTLPNGTYAVNAIQIKQTDIAGNVSNLSKNTLPIVVDTTGPLFTSPTAVDVEKNMAVSEIIYMAVATDDHSVTYTLKEGNQKDKFTISSTGELKYQEQQTQTGVHKVTIIATDIADNKTEQLITVSVTTLAQGFVVNGEKNADRSGHSVSSAGDVNGDGLDDLIIGAYLADPTGGNNAGKSYVVFGKTNATAINLSSITSGTGGFVINGENASDQSGYSVSSAGDVNGDGLDDLIIGVNKTNPNSNSNIGKTFVVFGKTNTTAINLSSITSGTGGFAINGESALEQNGYLVSSAGDVNGDGLDDLIVGAYWKNAADTPISKSYVIFGSKTNTTTINLSSIVFGKGGFVINGENAADKNGHSVSSAGDVNGDGLDDLIVSAYWIDPTNNSKIDKSYVIFGSETNATAINLSDIASGTGGFVINGKSASDKCGYAVSLAGDVNGDGLDDLIVGAYLSSNKAGKSYVVFGKKNDTNSIDLLNITSNKDGFVINGENGFDRSGYSVSSAGDVNGDGLDDLIVGAYLADLTNKINAGKSYVVFGKTDATAIDLSDIASGTGGFVINGENIRDRSGFSVSSAGDVNGDGLDDLIIGAYLADPANNDNAGKSYVVFGKTNTRAVNLANISNGTGEVAHAIDFQGDTNDTDKNDTQTGTSADELFVAGLGNDILKGNGGYDVFNAGVGNDTIIINGDNLAKLYSNTLGSHLLARVDGGSDTDTLKLEGGNLLLDLTTINKGRIQGIEIIDLNSGSNTLKLNLNDLLDISSETNILKVIGGTDDKVNIDLSAFEKNPLSKGDGTIIYNIYSDTNAATAQLWIEKDLGVYDSGTVI